MCIFASYRLTTECKLQSITKRGKKVVGHHTNDEQGKAIAEVSQERDQIHQQQQLGITTNISLLDS